MLPSRSIGLAVAVLLMAAGAAGAETWRSGPARTHLVELYTSQGCSSCPPAERWFSGLQQHAGLWRDFVPVAFHVTYWDNLGWPDRFADARYTARQRAWATLWHSPSVYTPGVVVDGREWPGAGGALPAAEEGPAGVLQATLTPGRECRMTYMPTKAGSAGWVAHAVLLTFGQRVQVKGGENSGRELLHDFVATALGEQPMEAAGRAFAATWPVPATPAARTALAVWVTQAGNPVPVQATGGYLSPQ